MEKDMTPRKLDGKTKGAVCEGATGLGEVCREGNLKQTSWEMAELPRLLHLLRSLTASNKLNQTRKYCQQQQQRGIQAEEKEEEDAEGERRRRRRSKSVCKFSRRGKLCMLRNSILININLHKWMSTTSGRQKESAHTHTYLHTYTHTMKQVVI